MLFAHGFGCDQNMWRFVAPAFEDDYRVVLFDHVGAGGSDLSAYDPERYALAATATPTTCSRSCRRARPARRDLRRALGQRDDRRARRRSSEPDRFAALVLVGPSPRYIDDDGYVGGFSRADIDELLESLDSNYLGWSGAMAPVDHGQPGPAGARRGADQQLLPHRPGDRPALRAGHLPVRQPRRPRRASGSPTLVLQCCEDVIAPDGGRRATCTTRSAGSTLVVLDATGHCPNLSAPERDRRGDRGVPRGRLTGARSARRRAPTGPARRERRGPLRERALRLPVRAAGRH